MQYQVLARKWRPQTFDELVGQDHVSRTLLNALHSGRVAHAFLLSGPRGSGKTTTARILAKALNCHAGKTGDPCGDCPACREIAAGTCMDVLEIDAASNRGIDEIRELRDNVRYSPARDRNKIFIIDEVHMLTPEAFNALLKTLEEPPAHVVFILATTEYHKIPATILSRCQQFNFKLIPYPLILERLAHIAREERIQIGGGALEQIAYSSGGSLRDAMSAFDQVIAFSGDSVRDEDVTMLLGLIEQEVLSDAVRAIARHDPAGLLDLVARLVESGQDLQNFCRRLMGQLRNLMVLKSGVSDPSMLDTPESGIPQLREQAELFSREDLLRLFDSLVQTEVDLKHATQIRFQLEMGLIRLAQITSLRPLEDLIADFTALVGEVRPEDAGAPGAGERPPASVPAARQPPRPEEGPKGLMRRIAAAAGKESLESLLLEVPEPTLQGGEIRLDLAPLSEFHRRQIRENLSVITRAAQSVLGTEVRVEVSFGPSGQAAPPSQSPAAGSVPSGESAVLERAKREPVVQAFLDVFPGPVQAEEGDT